MIWLDYSADTIFLGPVVTIDGDDYIFARYENCTTGDYTRDYMAFLKTPTDAPGTSNRTINIKAFFDYLRVQGFVTDDEYIDLISLGNEMWYGAGEVLIRNYSANVW